MPGVDITDPKTALKASAAALVAGRVLFPDINGNIVQDSNLFWDNVNKRLGIGNPSPSVPLHIGSDTASSQYIVINSAALNQCAIRFDTASVPKWFIYKINDGTDDLAINDSSVTVVLRLAQGGNLGVGLFGAGGVSHKLQLNVDDAAKPTTNTWTIASDKRLKKNITPFTDGLAILLQLNPINYQYTGDAGTPKDAQGIGLAAQDVEAVIPYCISKTKGKIKPTDIAETDIYNMNNHALVYVLINAVKQLNSEVTTLKNRLAAAGIP